MHFKKALAVIMAATMTTSMGVSAFAMPASNTHVVLTDEDGCDQIWVELTEENSHYDADEHEKVLNDDALEESRVIDHYERYRGEDITVIGSEVINVENLETGKTYNFVEGNINEGDTISGVVENGAELTFLGQGKDEAVTVDAEYAGDIGNLNPVSALVRDLRSMELSVLQAEIADKATRGEDIEEEFAKFALARKIQRGSNGGYESLTSLMNVEFNNLIKRSLEEKYVWEYGSADADAMAAYVAANLESYKAKVFEDCQEQKEDLLEYSDYYKKALAYKGTCDKLAAVLPADLENVTEQEMAAICNMYGLTKSQIQYVMANRGDSHMIIMPNSGFVEVVTPGEGFDDCEEGMITYYEGKGWMYGCTGGGVGFGDADGLKLVNIEKKEVPADAYTVIPANTIQLNEEGYGIVQLKDVKAQFVVDGHTYDIKSFEFLDDYVEFYDDCKDVHATVLIGGRPYTLTFNLLEWKANPTKPVSTEITPVEQPQDNTPSVTTPSAPVVNKFVEKAVAIGTDGTSIKTSAQKWFGYDYTNKVIEKKPVASQDVTNYLNECISGGKEYITFAPSGMDTAGITNLGTALSSVSNKAKVKGLDFSEVDVNPNCDLTGALAGYTNLDTLIISNWANFNQTILNSGLVGTGEKVYYYNALTNPEYIKYLDTIGWTGVKVDIDVSNKVKVSDAFMQWAATVKPQKFIFNSATSVEIFNYLIGLGWTPIVAQ